MEEKRLTFIEHLEELRQRIIKSIIVLIAAACLFYSLTDRVLSYLARPIPEGLVFIAPHEAFITRIKLALFGGLFFSLPFIIYQFWQFISSALANKERAYIAGFGIFSYFLFLVGSAFGYFIIVPIAITFLLGFSTDFLTPMLSVGRYVSFVGLLVLVFGLIFQVPIIILFLVKVGITTPQFLSRNRRYAIVIIFIVAAILTPPDVITQCLMAIPLIALYELSIFLARLTSR